MNKGLTDEESMKAIMDETHESAPTADRVKALASKGLNDPAYLAPAEIQELCSFVMRHVERHRSTWETIVDTLT